MNFKEFFELIAVQFRWDDRTGYWGCSGCKIPFDMPARCLHSSINCSFSKLKTLQKLRVCVIEENLQLYKEFCKSKGIKIIDNRKLDQDRPVPLNWYKHQMNNTAKLLDFDISRPSGVESEEFFPIPSYKATAEQLTNTGPCVKREILTGDPIIDSLPMADE